MFQRLATHSRPEREREPPADAADVQTRASDAVILGLLAGVVFLAVINGTMVNIALPFIGDEFDASPSVYGWVVTGFGIPFGIFSAIHGRLADRFGVRRMYLIGLLLLGVCSIAVSLAPTIEIMIAARVLQGAGSAALPALGPVIIARLLPASRRGASIGVILASVGFAASIGPFLGGFVIQFLGWRAVFLLTGSVLLAVPFAWKILPRGLDLPGASKFDLVGAILLGVGVTGLMVALSWLDGNSGPWLPAVVALGSSFLLVLFLAWIRRVDVPFIEPALLRNGRYRALLATGFTCNATRFGSIVLVPIFLVQVNELEPIWIGAVLLPGALAVAFGSRLAGRISDRVGARTPVVVGTLLIVVGNLVTAAYAGGEPIGVAAGMLLYGLGFASMQSPLLGATSLLLPRSQSGVGTGVYMMVFFLGGASGVVIVMALVDLQGSTATSVLVDDPAAAVFSNAVLALNILAVVGLVCAQWLPGREWMADYHTREAEALQR